ncbi:hypothetical protein [Bradyrhizobium diazoefficiens]|uniref:Uncharacterized protein n=1 Tax=Bradyrhizobium diazoefficiens TaxID=1355477 RepID=A0A810B365_9BRAD|nr:hypothetical protein XF8B_03710 [Bradyrhizobium diazoefficiens]
MIHVGPPPVAVIRATLDPWTWRIFPRLAPWERARVAAVCALLAGYDFDRGQLRDVVLSDLAGHGDDVSLPGRDYRARNLPRLKGVAHAVDLYAEMAGRRADEPLLARREGAYDPCRDLERIDRYGDRIGIPQLGLCLRAVLRRLAESHDRGDGLADALMGISPNGRLTVRERPPLERLRRIMEEHPLAPGRPSLYASARPRSDLLDAILACEGRRELPAEETAGLMRARFPEVHALWRDAAFVADRAADWLGITRMAFFHAAGEFEKHGRIGNVVSKFDARGGRLDARARNVVDEFYDPVRFKSFQQFFDFLCAREEGFGYSYSALNRYLLSTGAGRSRNMRLDPDAKASALAEFDRLGGIDSYSAFYRQMVELGFRYSEDSLKFFLRTENRFARPERAAADALLAKARAAAPIGDLEAFLRSAAPIGFACPIGPMREFLINAGVEVESRFAAAPPPAHRSDEGALPEEWRARVLAEHAREDYDSFAELYERLGRLDFRWSYLKLLKFMEAEGIPAPPNRPLDRHWRPKVLAEFDARPWPSYKGFHAHLLEMDCPHRLPAVREFLLREGRTLDDPPTRIWQTALLDAARAATPPLDPRAFHAALAPARCPMRLPVLIDFLRARGIDVGG